jgi:UDP-N-acetylglucosamine/UDP-N-acetylgalactosamine diphosphorylase
MGATTIERERRARARAAAAGQDHLFREFERWTPAQRERFVAQLDEVDFELVARHATLLRAGAASTAPPALEPAPVFPLERDEAQVRRAHEAREAGAKLLASGAVGYLLVAGGQASRLGFDGPKGAFRIGPVSDWTLFEIHARRLRAAAARHGFRPAWYVMTSPANERATAELFEANRWFGLPERDVRFFSQAMVPALSLDGRILLAAPGELFLAPNGHGGALSAFASTGALDDARRRGLRHLSYFQVDNPLAPPSDPLFLGLHALERARMSSKVVAKRDAAEKVGVIGRIDGRLGCIEYSDLPPELREARDERGMLRFRAGNIAMHVLDVDFVAALNEGGLQLPWHVARKAISAWEDGRVVQKQGAKFETFVFDALGKAERSVTLEVDRREQFSPVKNASGEDSPDTARADLCRLHASWARAAGLPLPAPDENGLHCVEIDPLIAEDCESFVARHPSSPRVASRGHWYVQEETREKG